MNGLENQFRNKFKKKSEFTGFPVLNNAMSGGVWEKIKKLAWRESVASTPAPLITALLIRSNTMTAHSISDRNPSVNPQKRHQKHSQQSEQEIFQPDAFIDHFDQLYDQLSLAHAMSRIVWQQDLDEIDGEILAKYLFGLYEHLEAALGELDKLNERDFEQYHQFHDQKDH